MEKGAGRERKGRKDRKGDSVVPMKRRRREGEEEERRKEAEERGRGKRQREEAEKPTKENQVNKGCSNCVTARADMLILNRSPTR